jgi:uncharacterized protein (TIGR04255 family)
MPKAKEPFPYYTKPPVNEVVIGVQFDTLEKFTAVYPGLYWQRIKDRYPQSSVHSPIATLIETFENLPDPHVQQHLQLSSTPPLPRCWFLDSAGNQLVQLQPERFLHNWRKVTGEEVYPRYNNILPEFEKLWKDFLDFAASENLGEVKPNQWEVTYVNHIYQGEGWNTLEDANKLFPAWSSESSQDYLPQPERINLDLTYAFPDDLARLHISLTPAYTRKDNRMLLRLNLTARGRLESTDHQSLLRCLGLGHEWIVRGFTDFTSPEAHALWELKE